MMGNRGKSFVQQLENYLRGQLCRRQEFCLRRNLGLRLDIETLEDRLAPAIFNVNSVADLLNPPPGVVTLRSAIQMANVTPGNNTINLTVGGTYKITLPGTDEGNNATGDFDILPNGGDLTIENTSGQAVTVDGNGLDRVFNINPSANPAATGTVLFGGSLPGQGFTITGGVTPNEEFGPGSGGGIEDQGSVNLILDHMVSTGNAANDDGGGIAMWNEAAATWTLTLRDSTVSSNRVGDAGGGVFAEGKGNVLLSSGTVITGNFAYNQGGGVWLDTIGNDSANLTVDGTVVSQNTAFSVIGLAGGIGNDGDGIVTITNSAIQRNSAGTTGGGFGDRHGLGTLEIHNSVFSGNTASSSGGAIAAGGPSTTITNSEFAGNSSSGGNGGALFAQGSTLAVQSCTFVNNAAQGNGGGMEIATAGTGANGSTIVDTTVTGNRAVNGGGIDAGSSFVGTLSLVNDTINTNTATNGGGIFWSGAGASQIQVENSILAHNQANSGPDANNSANTFSDQGGNLIGVSGSGGSNIGFTAPSTQTGTLAHPLDPMLGSLRNNGGPIVGAGNAVLTLETEAPMPGSPTIGHGMVAGAPSTDERGMPSVVNGVASIGGVQTIQPVSTSTNTVLTVSAPALAFNQPLTLTASVSSTNASFGVATGSVNFFDQGNRVATVSLSGGSAVFSMADLVLGTHVLTAVYAGDVTHNASNAPATAVIIGTANERFVGGLYQQLLQRQPDVAGLAGWTTALDQGLSRTQIALAFEASVEWRTDQVQALYRRLLHRDADPSGLTTYVSFLSAGGSLEQLAAILAGSDEYAQVRGGGTDNGFVTALYQDALNRTPDSSGLAAFLQDLSQGISRQQIAAVIFGSPEYLQDLVGSFYSRILGRAADSAGLTSFVQDLQAGSTDQVITAAMLGSDEFFAQR